MCPRPVAESSQAPPSSRIPCLSQEPTIPAYKPEIWKLPQCLLLCYSNLHIWEILPSKDLSSSPALLPYVSAPARSKSPSVFASMMTTASSWVPQPPFAFFQFIVLCAPKLSFFEMYIGPHPFPSHPVSSHIAPVLKLFYGLSFL